MINNDDLETDIRMSVKYCVVGGIGMSMLIAKKGDLEDRKNYITNKVRFLEEEMESWQKRIHELKEELAEIDIKLESINKYENMPIEGRILNKRIQSNTYTTDIFDEFEKKDENQYKKYNRLILSSDREYKIIVEHVKDYNSAGEINMTMLKTNTDDEFRAYVKEECSRMLGSNAPVSGQEIIFSKPFSLRAQSYFGCNGFIVIDSSIYELSDLYGNASDYAIVGIIFC